MNLPWFRIDLYNRVSSNVIHDWQMVDEGAFANFARSSSKHLSLINTARVLQADCNDLIYTTSRNLEYTFRALS